MKKMFKLCAVALSAIFVGNTFAQEVAAPAENQTVLNDWNISIGLSYRDFKAPKFKSVKSAGFIGAYHDSDGPSAVADLNSTIAKYADLSTTTLNVVNYSGGRNFSHGSYGLQESLGFVIGGNYTMWEQDSLRVSLAANFQYFQVDSKNRNGNINARGTVAKHAMAYGTLNDAILGDETASFAGIGGKAITKFDMDLYVLDLGASFAYDFENNLSAFLAIGPSISLADMESSSFANAANGKGIALSSARGRDNELEFEYGYYISGGASYWFNEQYGLSLEVRYDKAFGEVGTKYVSQNLDTWGGMLKFLVRF